MKTEAPFITSYPILIFIFATFISNITFAEIIDLSTQQACEDRGGDWVINPHNGHIDCQLDRLDIGLNDELFIPSGFTVRVRAELNNLGTISNFGFFDSSAVFTNQGEINNDFHAFFNNSFILFNEGDINNSGHMRLLGVPRNLGRIENFNHLQLWGMSLNGGALINHPIAQILNTKDFSICGGDFLNFGNLIGEEPSENCPPIAVLSFSPDPSGIGQLVTFDGSESFDIDSDDELEFYWDLTGDTRPNSSRETFDWLFREAGDYPVNLLVIDSGGQFDFVSTSGTVIFDDFEPPVFDPYTPPSPFITDNPAGARVTFPNPTATDNRRMRGVFQIQGPFSGQFIPVGSHDVVFLALDFAGNEATLSFQVEVKLTGTIPNLIAEVGSLDLPNGSANSLLSKLQNALKSEEKGNLETAINQVEAFINEVEAQAGKAIDEDIASSLIQLAQAVIQNLSN